MSNDYEIIKEVMAGIKNSFVEVINEYESICKQPEELKIGVDYARGNFLWLWHILEKKVEAIK